MKTRTKYILLFVLLAAALLVIVVGGKLYAAVRDPLHAFENGRTAEPGGEAALFSPEPAPAQEPSATGTPGPTAAPTPTPDPAAVLNSGRVTIALLGVDTNAAREEEHMGARADSIALLSVDLENPACSVLSVPRDTRAAIRRLNRDGTVQAERTDRINAAYAYGGNGGPQSAGNTLYALNELLGVQADYYAVLDMDGIAPLVESVGGVTVTLPTDLEGLGKKGETVTLNGETAALYVRRRKGVDDGSDVARTARQRDFLVAFAARVQQLGLARLPGLYLSALGFVETDLSLEQVVALGSVLAKLDTAAIETAVLPGRARTIDGRSFYIMDEEEAQALLSELGF